MADTQDAITETLRSRVLRGMKVGTLEPGDRLPSARDVALEFSVDHRLVLAAYRTIADEGLIEIRERGGIYVARKDTAGDELVLAPVKWLADTFTDALAREIPPRDLATQITRAFETLRLHAVVISTTDDQATGLARELHRDFGLLADGFAASVIQGADVLPAPFRRTDVLIGTSAHAGLAERLGEQIGKPVLAIEVRPDLAVGEWALLLRQPVWAIVASAEFGEMLRQFFADVPGIENLTVLVHGRDDLSQIPAGAPTYVTHRVRDALEATPIPGRILPPARTIAVESARQIIEFMVRANLRAARVLQSAAASAASAGRAKGA